VRNTFPGGSSSDARFLTNVDGSLLFAADDGLHGFTLWKSDGTAIGTKLVRPPGTRGSDPSYEVVDVRGITFFVSDDGSGMGHELWKSDGTSSGTVLVKDINPGGRGSSPHNLTNVGGTLYFSASGGTSGHELWMSDGTSTGTVLVKDIRPGGGSSGPDWLTNVGGTLYFSANDGTRGYELWRSDGTSSGTVLVSNVHPGAAGSLPSRLLDVGGTLFFHADDGMHGRELWKSDGTSNGTVLVRDISDRGDGIGYFDEMVSVSGVIYFAADDAIVGRELWKSDGTSTGTVIVKDVFPEGQGSYPYGFEKIGGTLYFSADHPASGRELWKSDGTSSGTVLVKDIDLGYPSSYPGYLTNVGGTLLFKARDATNGSELWRSDGTNTGTMLVKDIAPGQDDSAPRMLVNVGGVLYFSATDRIKGYELWTSDGTTIGTVQFDILPGEQASVPSPLVNVNGALYFTADDGRTGREPWIVPAPPADAGEIRGRSWHDVDGDGVQDEGEPGIEGWMVYLDTNGDGHFDVATELFSITDVNGDYTFTGLAAGNYTVAEVVPTATAMPGSRISIAGEGFDPGAATVMVFADHLGREFEVFATAVTSTSVEAPVPVFVDLDTFEVRPGTVQVSVRQDMAGGGSTTFAGIEHLRIEELPETGLPPGTLLREWLNATQGVAHAANLNYQRIGAASQGAVDVSALRSDLRAIFGLAGNLQAGIDALMQGTIERIPLGNLANAAEVYLELEGLAQIDRMIAAWVLSDVRVPGETEPLIAAFGIQEGVSDQSISGIVDQLRQKMMAFVNRDPKEIRGDLEKISDLGSGVIAAGTVVTTLGASLAGASIAPVLAAGAAVGTFWWASTSLAGAITLATAETISNVATDGTASLSDYRETSTFVVETAVASGIDNLVGGIASKIIRTLPRNKFAKNLFEFGQNVAEAYEELFTNDPDEPEGPTGEAIEQNLDEIHQNIEPLAPNVSLFSPNEAMTSEAGEGFIVDVALDSPPSEPVTIEFESSDENEGAVSPTSVTFDAENWAIPQEVMVNGVEDTVVDGVTAFEVTAAAQSADQSYDGIPIESLSVINADNDQVGRVIVTPTNGLETSEDGAIDEFGVVLDSEPTAAVFIPLSVSDFTEGSTSPTSLTFTPGNWNIAQTVTVMGLDDVDMDGAVPYTVVLGRAVSTDPNYHDVDPDDVAVLNRDNDGLADISVSPMPIHQVVLPNSTVSMVFRLENAGAASVANATLIIDVFTPQSVTEIVSVHSTKGFCTTDGRVSADCNIGPLGPAEQVFVTVVVRVGSGFFPLARVNCTF